MPPSGRLAEPVALASDGVVLLGRDPLEHDVGDDGHGDLLRARPGRLSPTASAGSKARPSPGSGPEGGDDLLGEAERGLGVQRMAEVHHEVVAPRSTRCVSRSSHCSEAASESGRSPATVTQQLRCRKGGSRPASAAAAWTMSRLRLQSSSPPVGAVPDVGWRPTIGRPICSPELPMQIGGMMSGRGVAAASSIWKYVPLERRVLLGPHQPADLDDLFELSRAARGGRREVVAVGQVFVLPPAGADAEHEASAGKHLERGGHLRDQGRVAVAVPEHVVAQHDVGERRRQPGERGPAFEEALLLLAVEAVEVVGDPHRVEVRQRLGEDVLLLVHHDRLEVAPSVTGDRRQPAEPRSDPAVPPKPCRDRRD